MQILIDEKSTIVTFVKPVLVTSIPYHHAWYEQKGNEIWLTGIDLREKLLDIHHFEPISIISSALSEDQVKVAFDRLKEFVDVHRFKVDVMFQGSIITTGLSIHKLETQHQGETEDEFEVYDGPINETLMKKPKEILFDPGYSTLGKYPNIETVHTEDFGSYPPSVKTVHAKYLGQRDKVEGLETLYVDYVVQIGWTHVSNFYNSGLRKLVIERSQYLETTEAPELPPDYVVIVNGVWRNGSQNKTLLSYTY